MRRLLGLGCAVLAASAGWAVDWKTLRPSGYVSDFAGVVDPASKAHIEAYASELQQATGAQIALVTIPSLEGEPPEDVAPTIARAWGVGQKGRNDGVLLLLAIHERRSRLVVGNGLVSALPAGFDSSVLREMRPALRAQQYGEAMMAAAETIGGAIARAHNVRLTTTLPRHLRPTIANAIPWPFLLCGILESGFLGFLVTYSMRRAGGGRRAFRPASALTGGAPLLFESGTHSSGGFGGFDSSDSFGGFGGGDCGGGRASSDW